MKNITLIQGHYSPREAREMLLSMVNQKINFHKIKNLSSEVCRYRPDESARRTIHNLTEAKEELLQLIEQAALTNTNIRIVSSLQIVLEEATQPDEMLLSA